VELAGLKSERSQTRTDTIDIVAADPVEQVAAAPGIDEQSVAEQLVPRPARRASGSLVTDGLLSKLTKRVLETALEAEMSDHLGYDKHDPVGRQPWQLP
jgi:putative transposase